MSENTPNSPEAEFKPDAMNGGEPMTVAPEPPPDTQTPLPAAAAPGKPKPRGSKASSGSETGAGKPDERAYAQYQVLAQAVLDTADNATRSAQAAANAARDLRQTSTSVLELGQANHKRTQIMLGVAGGLMLVGLIFFMIMGVRMISRINQLDAMVLAVGKRAVELNAGLESLSSVQQTMQLLAGKQAELSKSQAQLETRIDGALKQSESMAQKVPQETAKQVAATSGTLLKQVQDINTRLNSQTGAVKSLSADIQSLKSSTTKVDGLQRDVQALITLQKERYLEALQKNNQSQQREQAVQFPRKDAKPLDLNPRPQ